LLSNPRLIEAWARLYFDGMQAPPETRRILRSCSVRRYIKVLAQFDLNFDLFGEQLAPQHILEMLPDEFLQLATVAPPFIPK